MSDRRILLLATALGDTDAPGAMDMLCGIDLPNAVKYVAARGKIEAPVPVKSFNVESGYPGEGYRLQTLASWARGVAGDPCCRDGYDLFCLRALLQKSDPFAMAALVRPCLNPGIVAERCEIPAASLFISISDESGTELVATLFNLAHPETRKFLELAWDLYASGAVYSMSPYTFDAALNAAVLALDLTRQFNRNPQLD